MVQLGITLKNAVGTTNAYSQDVEDALVQFFTSSGLGRQLLHSIYTRVNPGADKQRLNQLLRWHSDAQCSPEEAVTLLLDLGIPRRRLRVLSRLISKRADVWYKQPGLRFGKPMPGRRRVNLAWKRMKEPLHLVGHIDKKTGIRNVSWPFDHWILSQCLQQNGHNKGVRTVQNFSSFEEIIFVRRFRSKKIPPAVGLMGLRCL